MAEPPAWNTSFRKRLRTLFNKTHEMSNKTGDDCKYYVVLQRQEPGTNSSKFYYWNSHPHDQSWPPDGARLAQLQGKWMSPEQLLEDLENRPKRRRRRVNSNQPTILSDDTESEEGTDTGGACPTQNFMNEGHTHDDEIPRYYEDFVDLLQEPIEDETINTLLPCLPASLTENPTAAMYCEANNAFDVSSYIEPVETVPTIRQENTPTRTLGLMIPKKRNRRQLFSKPISPMETFCP